ncbi:MFS transporter [Spongiactinospora sp. TRM90649]|uniref:MFS transporter n=1 Tax=Spongiactinospora sp. TRM90649 TaxID=3031114 RepID=UPI0023F83A89|nr:MFS transporter [Spongiactinospora sp. TRM90649]MDF5755303.1 MFS transporter [Spongiactinospora sp. TRM90649]
MDATDTTQTTPREPVGNARKWGTLAITCLATVLLGIDLTVLHLAIPSLVAELAPSATQILWIADIYGFALGGLLVTMGNLGDRVGRKRLLLIGVSMFGLASAATAYAPTPELLIASRALLGIAGATIMPSTLSIVRNVFTDPKERTAAIGLSTAMASAGIALGPIIGGGLLTHFWWGSVFLINLPVMALIFVAGMFVLPESSDPRPGRLDLPSVALSTFGLVTVIYAIKEAAHGGVANPEVWIAAAAGLTALVAFARRQTRIDRPLIDVHLFRRPAFTGSVGAALVATFAISVVSLIFSQLLQLVWGWAAWNTGLAMLPSVAGILVGAVLAAPLVSRLGRAAVVALGLGFAGLGLLGLVLADADGGYPPIAIAQVVLGLGAAATFTITSDTVLATVPKERAGAAAAISETAYELGGAVGIALLGSVLSSGYRARLELPEGALPPDTAAAVGDSVGAAMAAAAELPAHLAATVTELAGEAYAEAVRGTAVTGAAMLAVTAVLALIALRGLPKVIEDGDH